MNSKPSDDLLADIATPAEVALLQARERIRFEQRERQALRELAQLQRYEHDAVNADRAERDDTDEDEQ
ncbi:hypothetical protein [Actinoplanes sp. NPDC026623]|uniref:hypothetical protein n=1 Tax=Actinoplanes sp. NPDC026623 TaxID=3155610 RepID=UPI0033F351B8